MTGNKIFLCIINMMQTDTLSYKLAEAIRQISPSIATVHEEGLKVLRYGTRENATSESQDRDNKYISGKMWFKPVKDSIEMLVCSWMTSSTIILQDRKQEKPTMPIDRSGIKEEKYFFWSIVNWQPFSHSTPFLNIIKQLCKVVIRGLYFPDEMTRVQEGVSEPPDELVDQHVL